MSISASWIVLAVLLLRLLLKKAPKWISVILWGVVAIRLICPFSIESVMSLIPSAETVSPSVLISEAEINTGFETIDNVINPVISEATTTIGTEKAVNTFKLFILIFSKVWLIGIAILLVYTIISYWRVRRKVRTAVLLRDNVYQSEAVVSPFVLGVIKPKIYIPFNMGEQDEELVVAHEQAHIKRKDHWWKPLGFLILTLHWFNPLMWLGYVLLCRDIEIACDEKVVKELTNEQRADYSQALLTCSVNRRMIAACPLAFGEVGIKERVKSVLNYKKPAFWIIVISVIAIVIASTCLLTNPKTYDASDLDDKLQVLIDTSIAEHHESEYTKDNFITIDYEILDVDNSLSETKVYMWVLYMEYSCENGVLKKEAGAHIPTVITAKKNANNYELVEYWTPRDGSYWVDDIKAKFPMSLWSRATDSQRSIDKQTAECKKMAKEYFGISESTVGGVSGPQNIVTVSDFPTKEQIYSDFQTKGKDYALEKLSGYSYTQLLEKWGEAGNLSGFWGNVWKIDESKSIAVYYDSEGVVENILISISHDKKVDEIIDVAKRDNIPCDDALQCFFIDAEYEYFYYSHKSEYVIVKYSDGSEKTVEDALKSGDIGIEDLDAYNIDYRRQKR